MARLDFADIEKWQASLGLKRAEAARRLDVTSQKLNGWRKRGQVSADESDRVRDIIIGATDWSGRHTEGSHVKSSLFELPGWDNLSAMSQKNLGRVVAALGASGERKELFLQRLADVLERKTQAEMNLETQPISGERLALVNLVSVLAGQLTEEQAVTVQSVFGSFVALGAAKEVKEKSATKKVYKVMESTRSATRQVSAAERIKAGAKTVKGSR